MSYVKSVLLPGETVLHEAHVHWVIYLPSLWLVALWIPCAWALMDQPALFWIINGVFAFFTIGVLFSSWIGAVSTELAVTDKRVIAKTGFIRRSTHEIARHKIEGVAVQQSLTGRMLNFGTVTVRGTGGGLAPMTAIANPVHFRNVVSHEVDKEGAAERLLVKTDA
jgi:uncharacterized membrane protein YdbT with pleckstrin-like domain